MDRVLLVASTFCFLFGFAYTMYAPGTRTSVHGNDFTKWLANGRPHPAVARIAPMLASNRAPEL